ncbi:MAG: glycoside hydrolase family 113 [Roseiarcus sp.]
MTLSLTNQGFDYVSYYNGAYENANSLDALAATGANSIEASLDYGINPKTDKVYADSSTTDSLAALGATIRQATALGLSVMVRPLIDFVNPADLQGTPYSVDEWRTYFNPGAAGSAGANAFFASYQTMILQEAQVAVANGATSLCIGTELDQITGPAYKSYWDSIITALRTDDPSLKLTYAADWDDDLSPWRWGGTGLAAGAGNLATQVSFAGELDSIGVDCYAPISDAAHPTLAQLVAGWTQTPTDPETLAVTGGQSLISYFESVSAAVGKPLIFTELGCENASDAASQPAGSSTNVVDSTLQAQLYQAFFEAWQQAGNSSLTGVYFWNWDPNAAEVGPGEGVNFSPQGLPAQAVATDWFGAGPAIAFAAPSFGADDAITLTGTASDSAGLQSVEIFNGTSDLGAATVDAASGAWSFPAALPAGSYTFTALATDQDGKQSTGLASFVVATGIAGQPYAASVTDFDATGALSGRSLYDAGGGLYRAWTLTQQADGDYVQDFAGGSFFTGKKYSAWSNTYDSSGRRAAADLLSRTYDMNSGAHVIDGYADGQTFDSSADDRMTGGGARETFVFNPGFGADEVTDFAEHLTGPGADTISVSTSQFADFTALLAATRNAGANVVITAPNHDTITLLDMTRALVASHAGDLAFHA